MKEPKYKIGDEVWAIQFGKARLSIVEVIYITIDASSVIISYRIREKEHGKYERFDIYESCVSPTKEDLIKSL